jgi:hypothetical protein
MGCFGKDTEKPVWLFSPSPFILDIDKYQTCKWIRRKNRRIENKHRKCSATRVQTYYEYTNKKGERKYNGGRDLKGTQNYTPEFGYALSQLYLDNASKQRDIALATEAALQTRLASMTGPFHPFGFDVDARAHAHWPDAGLNSVLNFLAE